MATLRGLFEPKTQNQRNFLRENIRKVKSKPSLNDQKSKNETKVLQKKCSSANSVLASSCHGAATKKIHVPGEGKSSSCRNLSVPEPANLPSKNPSRKKGQCKPDSLSSRQSATSSRTVHYIHQENIPFEWTEVCPSLISHNICHQGVQTEDNTDENLSRMLKSEERDCKTHQESERNQQSHQMEFSPRHSQVKISEFQKCNHTSSPEVYKEPPECLKLRFPEDKNLQLEDDIKSRSARHLSDESNFKFHLVPEVQKQPDEEHFDQSNAKSSHLISDFENFRVSSSRKSATSLKTKSNPILAPSSYQKGVIPKYLSKRKTELAEASSRARDFDPNCPLGHVAMADVERRETLDMILKNYNDLITELNKMPVRTDTLKTKQRKIEIEKQLDKLEEGIRVFSRSKVYIKLNA